MRKVFRKLVRLFLRLAIFVVLIIAGIFTVNTIAFSSKQVPVDPIEPIAVSDDVVDRLASAVKLPTISGEGIVDTSAFLLLDTLMAQSFPLIDSLLGRTTINQFSKIYHWPGRKNQLPPILLIAHMDVVPAEESSLDAWEQAPFSGIVADDHIWGRGTLDDKGSVFAILEAVEQLLAEDYLPERTIYLAFGHDEEVRGKMGAQAMASHFQSKDIRFDYVLDEASLIIEDALPGLSQPLAMIGVAEKGYVTLKITASLPEGGHSSMPPPETAIGLLSRSIDQLQNNLFPAKVNGATARLLDYAGPEMNFPFNVLFANRWLTERLLIDQFTSIPGANAMIRTTTAPTMLSAGVKSNVLPSTASAIINFRILPGETVAYVKEYVEEIIADERVTIEVMGGDSEEEPSPVSDSEAFGFQVIQKTIQELFPEVVVAPSLVIAATDSRHYSAVSDHIYRFTPVQLEQEDLKKIHGINEKISIEAYKQMIRFYRQLILNSSK